MANQASSRIAAARTLIARGDHAGAEREFRAALDVDPKDATALVGLAQALLAQGRKADALEPCERAADLHAENGRADKAIEVYGRVVKIDPLRGETLVKLADTLHAAGRTRDALDRLRDAAEAFRAKDKPKQRLDALKRLLERTPERERSPVRVQIADALSAAGDAAMALRILREESRLLEAVGALEIASQRGSTRSPTYNLLLNVLERIVALDPKDLDAHLRLGRFQLASRPARAIATLQAALKLDRKSVLALKLLDHAFLAVGQFDKAALTFEEVRVLDPAAYRGSPIWGDEEKQLAAVLSEIDAAAQHNLDEARDKARMLIAARPGSIPARLKMSELFARTANLDAAVAEVTAAVVLALEAGDVLHARVVLQEGLRLSPNHPGMRESCVRVTELLQIL